jgi:hypothetical protein
MPAGPHSYPPVHSASGQSWPRWTAEYSDRGVRFNTVAPGPVHTRPEARDLFDTLAGTTAMKRAAEPAEIAEVVVCLASPKASYVAGAAAVDGGPPPSEPACPQRKTPMSNSVYGLSIDAADAGKLARFWVEGRRAGSLPRRDHRIRCTRPGRGPSAAELRDATQGSARWTTLADP